ncbi:MAG: tetratricopeptide repeat protein [Calditrichaeota bacterium]|nr:MAG: tetratricopeptide repeat protein [Calditrichota bacterium]MBL1206563.1 tetratricopeptide repeat protein [Calditrichota bacterium]NOG46390.1 tetratricopeptide repeat protein [Calditrichota bacterium]
MDKNVLKSILIFLFSIILITGCAGSREESDDYLSEDEKQQKELDDIEALLGISSDENQPEKKAEETSQENDNQQSEKLDLLGTSEMIDNSQPATITSEEKKKLERKISQLEQQLREKDQSIADLNAQVTVQEAELNKRPSYSGGTAAIVSDISMEEYQSRYDDARAEFEARNYESAIQLFESLISASTSHNLSDNAQFWIGECHYALRQYDAAIIDFEKVFTFANSNKADASQYKLGLCYMRKGDTTKAREEFDRLIRNYPDSPYSTKAETLLSQN